MGLRGKGAKPRSTDIMGGAKLRAVLPWEIEGLSRVEAVVAFLEDQKITQGKLAGENMRVRPWQREILDGIYATDEAGNRLVRTAILSLARKNGKTALVAGLVLCHLCGPEAEDRGEIYIGAVDKQQASKAWAECKAMLEAHAELSQRVNIIRFSKEIEVLEGPGVGSVLKAVSSDADSKLGLSPSMVVMDEAGYHRSRDLYDAFDTAMGAREEPLMVLISTQAKDDLHYFSQLIDDAVKMETGERDHDPSVYLKLYTTPIDADIFDPETWYLANPALGDFRSLEDFERQANAAKRMPSKEPDFRNKLCNQRVDASVRFIRKNEWDACSGEVDERELEGRDCYAGLDLSQARDLTAFVMVFPDVDGRTVVLPRFMLPEQGLAEKSEMDRVPYSQWAKEGHLITVPGKTIDPADVCKVIAKDAARFNIVQMGFDRWRIEDFKREAAEVGLELDMLEIGQGFQSMSPCVDALERAVAETVLLQGCNPVMTMCAANAVVTTDAAGARKLDKSKASGRIDGLVALAMALRVADAHAEAPYELPAFLS